MIFTYKLYYLVLREGVGQQLNVDGVLRHKGSTYHEQRLM
jgi:hypothetical protein